MTLFGPLPAAAAAPPVDGGTAPHQRPASQAASTAAPARTAHTTAGKDPAATRGYAAPLCNADAQTAQRSPPRPAAIRHRPAASANGGASAGLMPTKMTGMSSAMQRQHQAQHRTHSPGRAKEKAKQSGSTCKAPPGARTASLIHHGVAPHHGPTQHRTARQCGATHRHRHRTPSLAPHRAASRCPRLCAPKCVG